MTWVGVTGGETGVACVGTATGVAFGSATACVMFVVTFGFDAVVFELTIC